MKTPTRLVVVLLALGACGGDDGGGPNHVEQPTPAAGGGVHAGAIDGEVNIFVIDDDTDAPLAGAQVLVTDAAGATVSPAGATTDASGLLVISDAALSGPVDITVAKGGYRSSAWLGANGAVVTVPLAPATRPAVPSATVSGTITGWDSLPAPPTNHILLALVGFSQSEDLSDRGNDLQQPPALPGQLPPNACAKTAQFAPPCAWTLLTRTGPQAHYALLIDIDTKGTPDDGDNTMTLVGYALATGLGFTAGQTASGESLMLLGDPLEDYSVSFSPPPSGVSLQQAIPFIHLGDQRLPVAVPVLSSSQTSGKLPARSGPLAGATVDFFVVGKPAQDSPAQSINVVHDADLSAEVALGPLLDLPGQLSTTGGTYGFAAVAGANLMTASFEQPDGSELLGVALLDGRTSFELSPLAMEALPAGNLELHVTALVIPDFQPTDFSVDDFIASLSRTSEGFVAFTL